MSPFPKTPRRRWKNATGLQLLACLLASVTGPACAAKRIPTPAVTPPPVAVVIDLTPADALLKAGCYRCLRDAYTLYERARNSPAPPSRARDGAFVTAVLLALREKELDLDATPWLTRARAIATPDDAQYLDFAALIPWDAAAAADFETEGQLNLDTLARWRAAIEPQRRHPELDDYLGLTLECHLSTRVRLNEALLTLDLTQPLLQYRAGLCGAEHRPKLELLVQNDPRFAEAWYFIARYEMATGVNALGPSRRWLVTAVKPLAQAHEALPEVPTITSVLAGLMRARNELRRALGLYDEALAIRPGHGEALFGRAITLSFLKRHDEAIAAADEIIRRERGHLSSAFYYRAWNEYQQTRLDEAARDVATARRLRAPEEVLVLSGLVAYDQKRPIDARADFTEAINGNPSRCVALWFLGILNIDEEAWRQAVTRFESSAQCYQTSVAALQREAAQLPSDLPDDIRAEQVSSFEDNIVESTKQVGRSFFNAAQGAMRVGDTAAARQHAREALSFDDVRERADAMLKKLEREARQEIGDRR